MRRKLIDHFLHQSQIAGHLSGRDIPKRVVTAVVMAGICHFAGFTAAGVVTCLGVILVEIIAYPLNKRASYFDKPLDLRAAISVFGVNWAAMFPFLSYGIILAQSDSLPFVLTGFSLAFGTCVHVSNMFGLLPLYNWSQMTLAFGALFLMLWSLTQNPAHSGAAVEWVIAATMLFIYIFNTFDTMNLQKDTHRALERARKDANARLMALEQLSRSDSLTGLMNRRAFDEVVQSMMHQHADKQGVTVFMLDLDGFKPINDSYGHEAGDAVLCAIANRLELLVGRGDRVARVGGDEFAVLTAQITSAREARMRAAVMIEKLSETIPYEQKTLEVGISVGIARQGPDASTPPELMSGADQAMYLAKQDPETQLKIYDRSAFPVRPSLEDRRILIEAMESGQIVPHYQPKVRIDTGEVVGFEALSRWQHPTRGTLSPAHFLPMINELALQGKFMLHTAEHVMRDLDALVADGLNPGQVSVNMSEVTLATLLGRKELFNVIERYPHLRSHLTFEITEDIFIARSSEIIRRSILLFRQSGVRISLDDFGTGYASLQHLKELEFDELKLDTGFVRDLGHDPAAKVLIEGLVTISKGLNVDLIAEGVETEHQRDMLRDLGCNFVQGYYYGAAMPFAETQVRLLTGKRPPGATAPKRSVA